MFVFSGREVAQREEVESCPYEFTLFNSFDIPFNRCPFIVVMSILVVPKSIDWGSVFDLMFDHSLIEGYDIINFSIFVVLDDEFSGG